MKKRMIFWLGIVAFPFLIMVLVNTFSPQPDHTYDPAKCSRYCHDKGCPHVEAKKESFSHRVYNWHIRALKNNGLGLSYSEANILVYVIFFPLLMAGLLWGALPNFRKNG